MKKIIVISLLCVITRCSHAQNVASAAHTPSSYKEDLNDLTLFSQKKVTLDSVETLSWGHIKEKVLKGTIYTYRNSMYEASCFILDSNEVRGQALYYLNDGKYVIREFRGPHVDPFRIRRVYIDTKHQIHFEY
jgi:hypothetical protein